MRSCTPLQDIDSLFEDPLGSTDRVNDPAYGLRWVRDDGPLSVRSEWTVEPTMDSIIQTLQKVIDPNKHYIIRHCSNGAYSKIYSVSYDGIHLVLKVYLPVCPKSMTESEVATLRWVDRNTRLPVPKVRHYDSSRNNPIGFEWILMDRIEGLPLFQCWESITQGAKERIVKQVAEYATICFVKQFHGVGNIYPLESHQSYFEPLEGEMWTRSRFRLISSELQLRSNESTNENHREVISNMLDLLDRLRELEDKFFQPPGHPDGSEPSTYVDESTDEEDAEATGVRSKSHEPTMLWHDDISLDNIFVDENGVLEGIIGWSCVSCIPRYEACQFPAFLHQAFDRPMEPRTPYRVTRRQPQSDEEINRYRMELKQYKLTLLRQLFIDEMMQRCPEWVDIFYKQRYRRDYEAAVQNCDNEFAYKIVEEWVGDVESSGSISTVWSLHERLMS
ncbi:kinase-like domain-containing protein [Daldinia sp. FL1419]|nr:kinase-like domain-containing protein [Daldinia sp. FL1419]